MHPKVAAEYGRRRWIEARCEREKETTDKHLTAMRAASTLQERLDGVWAFLSALSGLLAVAQLKRPTTRRTLALLGELLEAQGRPDLHEAALTLFGSAHMSGADVKTKILRYLQILDTSLHVIRVQDLMNQCKTANRISDRDTPGSIDNTRMKKS